MLRLSTGIFCVRLTCATLSVSRYRLMVMLGVLVCFLCVFFFEGNIKGTFIRYYLVQLNMGSSHMNFLSIPSNASYFLRMNFCKVKRVRISSGPCVQFISARARYVNNSRSATFSYLPTLLTSIFNNIVRSNVMRVNNSIFIIRRFNGFLNATAITRVSSNTSKRATRSIRRLSHLIFHLTSSVNGIFTFRARTRRVFLARVRANLSVFRCFQDNNNYRYRSKCTKRGFTCFNCLRVNKARVMTPLQCTITFICHGRASFHLLRFNTRSFDVRPFKKSVRRLRVTRCAILRYSSSFLPTRT